MGKAGRFACIFIPMALTIASLVCLIFVFLGSRDAKNGTTNQYWFFRADTSNFTTSPNVDLVKGSSIDNNLIDAIGALKTANNISDFYQIGLWNYCDGNKTNSDFNVDFCSKPEQNYFFNLTEVWGLSGSEENLIPKTLSDGLKAYQKVAHWMFIAYSVALAATALEIFVGFFAVFSRWGSCVTTIVSSVRLLPPLLLENKLTKRRRRPSSLFSQQSPLPSSPLPSSALLTLHLARMASRQAWARRCW